MRKFGLFISIFLFANVSTGAIVTDSNVIYDYVFSINKSMVDNDTNSFITLIEVGNTITAYEKFEIDKEEAMKSLFDLMVNDSISYINIHLDSFYKLGDKIRRNVLPIDSSDYVLKDGFRYEIIGEDLFYDLRLIEVRVHLKCLEGIKSYDFIIGVNGDFLFLPIPIAVLGQFSMDINSINAK